MGVGGKSRRARAKNGRAEVEGFGATLSPLTIKVKCAVSAYKWPGLLRHWRTLLHDQRWTVCSFITIFLLVLSLF